MKNIFWGVLILALFVLFVLAVVPVFAGGEGYLHNCPGPILTEIEGSGVRVYCIAWTKHCDYPVKIWNNGTEYINVECDNGKPLPPPPNAGGF